MEDVSDDFPPPPLLSNHFEVSKQEAPVPQHILNNIDAGNVTVIMNYYIQKLKFGFQVYNTALLPLLPQRFMTPLQVFEC